MGDSADVSLEDANWDKLNGQRITHARANRLRKHNGHVDGKDVSISVGGTR